MGLPTVDSEEPYRFPLFQPFISNHDGLTWQGNRDGITIIFQMPAKRQRLFFLPMNHGDFQ
jgi:hypothetical protein